MKFYDSHCHLNMPPLLTEAEEIAKHCQGKQIFLNCVGVDLNTSVFAVDLSKKFPNVKAVIGIHPNDAIKEKLNEWMLELEKIYLNNKETIVSIGETGLDYHYDGYDPDTQKKFFIAHLELAKKYNLPVQIHIRNANEDAYEILLPYAKQLKIIIHCFSSSQTWAKKYSDLGFYISIPGIITFENSSKLKKAVTSIPIKQLLVETDSPWLAPAPHYGEINSPIYIPYVLKELSKIFNISEEEFADTIFDNSISIFKI